MHEVDQCYIEPANLHEVDQCYIEAPNLHEVYQCHIEAPNLHEVHQCYFEAALCNLSHTSQCFMHPCMQLAPHWPAFYTSWPVCLLAGA